MILKDAYGIRRLFDIAADYLAVKMLGDGGYSIVVGSDFRFEGDLGDCINTLGRTTWKVFGGCADEVEREMIRLKEIATEWAYFRCVKVGDIVAGYVDEDAAFVSLVVGTYKGKRIFIGRGKDVMTALGDALASAQSFIDEV